MESIGSVEKSMQNYIKLMGNDLGMVYNYLCQDIYWLHSEWAEYIALYGTNKSRVDTLNKSAPQFFYIAEKSLWATILLHITRLTDPPKYIKKKVEKKNLSLQQLNSLITDALLYKKLIKIMEELNLKSKFCRDWRNRYLTHNDYELAVSMNAKPLEFASRKLVATVIKSIDDVMNCISMFYEQATTEYDVTGVYDMSHPLIYYLDAGLEAEVKDKRKN